MTQHGYDSLGIKNPTSSTRTVGFVLLFLSN